MPQPLKASLQSIAVFSANLLRRSTASSEEKSHDEFELLSEAARRAKTFVEGLLKLCSPPTAEAYTPKIWQCPKDAGNVTQPAQRQRELGDSQVNVHNDSHHGVNATSGCGPSSYSECS